MRKTRQPVDVVLVADGESVFPLKKGDVVDVRRCRQKIRFVEIEPNYFFKSLQEKFAFE